MFQIDGTYKLIWVPDKSKEGFPVQVHGTSNLLNEFFPTGLCVTSNEDAKTYQEIFESFDENMKFLMADGAAAITKAWEMATKDNPEFQTFTTERAEVPLSRLMCYFHVDKDCSKIYEKFTNKNHSAEIKDDISIIQLSQSREEFDEANLMFYVKWLSVEDEIIEKFIEYYHHNWVASKQSNWYVGARPK